MSNYAVGTVLNVIAADNFNIPSSVVGESFHLDADRVWRNVNGNGDEYSDSLFDSYASQIHATSDVRFSQPAVAVQAEAALANPTPATSDLSPWGLVHEDGNIRVFAKSSTNSNQEELVSALLSGVSSVTAAYAEVTNALGKLETVFNNARTEIEAKING